MGMKRPQATRPDWVVIARSTDAGLAVEVRQARAGEVASWDDEDEPDDWGDDDLFMRANVASEADARALATMIRATGWGRN